MVGAFFIYGAKPHRQTSDTEMIITTDKLRERFNQYGIKDHWLPQYEMVSAKAALTLIGQAYHDLMRHKDIRMMTDGEQRFVRLVIQFPPQWKATILVTDNWDEVAQFLQVNIETPINPAEVKARWPQVKKKLMPVCEKCTQCNKPVTMGCVIDAAKTVRLCRACTYRYGLGVYFRPQCGHKNEVGSGQAEGFSSKHLTPVWTQLLEKATGIKVGEPQIEAKNTEEQPKFMKSAYSGASLEDLIDDFNQKQKRKDVLGANLE